MHSDKLDVKAIFSAVAVLISTATRRSAACTAVCAGGSVRRAARYAGLLAFRGDGNARGQIPLRRDDGGGRAGCGREGDKGCGVSVGDAGLGGANIRRRFFSTHLRALRETWGGTSVQFQFGTGGGVWQHGRGDVP